MELGLGAMATADDSMLVLASGEPQMVPIYLESEETHGARNSREACILAQARCRVVHINMISVAAAIPAHPERCATKQAVASRPFGLVAASRHGGEGHPARL